MPAQASARPRRPGRALLGWGIVLLVAAALLGLGTGMSKLSASVNDPDAPTCNDKVMGPGDRCIRIGGGKSETLTYDEMVERLRENRRKAIAFGNATTPAAIVTAILAVAMITAGVARRRSAKRQAVQTPRF